MKVLNVVPYWGLNYGGPMTCVGDLSVSLKAMGHDVMILTTSNAAGAEDTSYAGRSGTDRIAVPVHVARVGEGLYRCSLEFMRKFDALLKGVDIVCTHGLWQYPISYAAYACRKNDIPYIMFTHNMLTPWSLGSKPLRKWLYLKLIEQRNMRGAKCIFGMRQDELQSANSMGINGPLKMVYRSLVHQEEFIRCKNERDAAKRDRSSESLSNLLFLSRIHPKKGLVHLVLAMPMLIKRYPQLKLVIAGPIEDEGYFKQIQSAIRTHGLEDHVSYIGAVAGKDKTEAFSSADIFILPSYDDMPLVIPEAMGYGLPIIATPGCGWPNIDGEMGLVTDPDAGAIARAVTRLLEDPCSAIRMGENAHQYVMSHYAWSAGHHAMVSAIEKMAAR
jgi:glycosyltransferase involved in cell wall biosynthesis